MNVCHICDQALQHFDGFSEIQVNKNIQCVLIQLINKILYVSHWKSYVDRVRSYSCLHFSLSHIIVFHWFNTTVLYFANLLTLIYPYTCYTMFHTKFYTKAIVKYRTPFHSYLWFVRISTLCSLSKCNFRSYSIIILFWDKHYSKILVIPLNAYTNFSESKIFLKGKFSYTTSFACLENW